MIITRTPFRVSFGGGGTDLPEYYKKHGGAALSTSINKYMYISIHPYFDSGINIKYSKTEQVKSVEEIQHPLVREAMKLSSVLKGVEISSISDIPSGTGLGSSSSFTVGLMNALYAYQGRNASAEKLARDACDIELNKVKSPIGKQDQYAAAYGGLNFIEFNADESVSVRPVMLKPGLKREMNQNLMAFYTGSQRSAASILEEQRKSLSEDEKKLQTYHELKKTAHAMLDSLKAGDIDNFGRQLDSAWKIKKRASSAISNSELDALYALGIKNGALGGKLLGAGGSGFMLFYVPEGSHERVRKAFSSYKELPFNFDSQGSRIIHVGDEY